MFSNRTSNRLMRFLILFIIGYIIYIISYSKIYKQQKLFNVVRKQQQQQQQKRQQIRTTKNVHPIFKLNSSLVKTNKNQLWSNIGVGSRPGSTIEYTANVRSILYDVIKKYSIKSMLDAPCGPFVWMPLLLSNVTDEFWRRGEQFRYHGVDVVESIINASKVKWALEPDWQFSVCDFTEQHLPDNYDLIFSRDALQHLSYEKIFYSLRAFARVRGARYLLIGSYVESAKRNANIRIGDYFSINLLAPPFNLNEYVRIYYEARMHPMEPLKSLILYDVANYLSKFDFDRLKTDLNITT